MAWTLRDVHGGVSSWLRRGNVFDSSIPAAAEMAARSIERNYTFKYMEQYVTFTILWESQEPRAVNFPNTKVKAIRSIRVPGADGAYSELLQVDPREVRSLERGQPQRYWLDGVDYIWFDRVPDKDYPAEMLYDRYTTWPSPADSTGPTAEDPTIPVFDWLDSTNWLIENGFDALIAHTLGHMKILARLPPDMRQEIDAMTVRAMNEMVRADEEIRRTNTSLVMNYGVVE